MIESAVQVVEDPFAGSLADLETAPAEELVKLALERWPGRVALVTSFQAEGMVLLDMACRLESRLRVLTLDTGRLHQETYQMVEQVQRRYGVTVEVLLPDTRQVEAMVQRHGPNLFRRSRQLRLECCRVRKVEPLARALCGLDAWLTGLRREQSPSRAGISKVQPEERPASTPEAGEPRGIVKLSPLADWTTTQVWDYLEERDVPVHPLYQEGYTSIGCQPCTRPIRIGEDSRAGRWWWESAGSRECGLHFPELAAPPAKPTEDPS